MSDKVDIIEVSCKTGVEEIVRLCMEFPETKWLIAADSLKTIKSKILPVFGKVLGNYTDALTGTYPTNISLREGINFNNGSRILLFQAEYYASDPHYARFYGLEVHGGLVYHRRVGDITNEALEVMKNRMVYSYTHDLIPVMYTVYDF